jgi:hypothetical protein
MAEVSFAQHAVAFLDILGFKNFITAAEVSGSEEFAQFSQLLGVIDRQLQLVTDDGREQHKFPRDVGLTTIHISDSFVLSAPVNNEARPDYSGLVAVAIKTIQLAHRLIDMGFLLRGGIAVGSVYRTPINIFGTGYQKAFETENDLAKTPRVLLHESAAARLETDYHSCLRLGKLSIFMREGEEYILDTLYTHWSYVGDQRDYDLVKLFNDYKATIEHKLSTLSDDRARSKWEWMAKFFNAKQRDCSDLRGVSPIGLDQSSAFAFGPVIKQPPMNFREAFGPFLAPTRYVKSFKF